MPEVRHTRQLQHKGTEAAEVGSFRVFPSGYRQFWSEANQAGGADMIHFQLSGAMPECGVMQRSHSPHVEGQGLIPGCEQHAHVEAGHHVPAGQRCDVIC